MFAEIPFRKSVFQNKPPIWAVQVEKAREFDPFGHAGLTPLGIIRLTPSGKIKMTPVDDTAGEFFCSFENPCPGTAGFNVKYYKI